ncbi:putative RNA-directed DNA polymerase [Operophtera brumata]|uniref:Putative RNA-directed DNA polymerase n=1 Tax=Operophtera brumata TaxID=104452 RepID=A0A0L7LU61_OPEBR|nr:putative RNA-directed DNA polymerase [Operophtera brumata]
MDSVVEQINLIDFSQIFNIEDANCAADLLINKMMEIIKINTRIFRVLNSQRTIKPWITPGLLRCIRTRDRMHMHLKQNSGNLTLKTTYVRYRNFCNKLLRKVKINYEKSELEKHKHNIKKTWQTIRQITYTEKSKSNCDLLLNLKANPQLSVDHVNIFFVNVGKSLAANIKSRSDSTSQCDSLILDKLPSQVNSMGMLTTDEREVYGLTIDDKVTWRKHIETLTKRVRKFIYIFKYLREVADRKLLINIYNALCRSILAYCNVTWGGTCSTYMLQLERAQRAVLKVATFKPYRFPTADLFNECEVLTVRQMYILNIILTQHKSVDVHYNLSVGRRRKDRIAMVPKCNTTSAHRQQFFLGPFMYNKASKYIQNLVKLNKTECKNSLIKWLMTLNYKETEELLKIIK